MCSEDETPPLHIDSVERRTFMKNLAGTAALGLVGFPALAKPPAQIKAVKLSDLRVISEPNTSVTVRVGSEDVLLVRDAQNKLLAFNPT